MEVHQMLFQKNDSGIDQLESAKSLNQLAIYYRSQGKLAEAKRFNLQALAIIETCFSEALSQFQNSLNKYIQEVQKF